MYITFISVVLYLIDDLSDLCHFCGEAETFDDSEGEAETLTACADDCSADVLWVNMVKHFWLV